MNGPVRKSWGFCRTHHGEWVDYENYRELGTDRDTSAGWPVPSDEIS